MTRSTFPWLLLLILAVAGIAQSKSMLTKLLFVTQASLAGYVLYHKLPEDKK